MIPKYPRTIHIGDSRMPPGIQNPEGVPFSILNGKHVVIEEKLDGIQLGVMFDDELSLKCFTRNTFITTQKHLQRYKKWCSNFESELLSVLEDRYILYFEGMEYFHTIRYNQLPKFYIECDVYDRIADKFLSTTKRQDLLKTLDFISAPIVYQGVCNGITQHLKESKYIQPNMLPEGLYIKVEDRDFVLERYKWIRKEFIDNILSSDHWLKRGLKYNTLCTETPEN